MTITIISAAASVVSAKQLYDNYNYTSNKVGSFGKEVWLTFCSIFGKCQGMSGLSPVGFLNIRRVHAWFSLQGFTYNKLRRIENNRLDYRLYYTWDFPLSSGSLSTDQQAQGKNSEA